MVLKGSSRKDLRRARILEAAAELLEEKGAAGTTLEEIADRAGVVRRTVYNHFPSKEDLFREMLEPMRSHILERIDSFNPERDFGTDALGALCAFLFSLWDTEARNIELFSDRTLSTYSSLHSEFADVAARLNVLFADPRVVAELRLDAECSAHLAYSCMIPLGRVFKGRPDGEKQFTAAMRGLLAKGPQGAEGGRGAGGAADTGR